MKRAMNRLLNRAVCTGLLAAAALLAGCAGRPPQAMDGSALPSGAAELLAKQQFVNADGEAARSEALFQSLLRKLPNDADTWFRLGNLYAANNRPEPAASAYGRALLADNAHARAWHNLAVIRLREAYAALLQAQTSVDSNDEVFAKRIDELIDQLAGVSALGDLPPRPAKAGAAKAEK